MSVNSTPETTGPPVTGTPLLVVALLLVDSLHFVFARLLAPHLPPETSALFVLGVATVETAVFLGLRRRISLDVARRHARFFLTVGLLVALSTVSNYAAVSFVDPGTASLLGKTSLIFALLLGLVWLRERLTVWQGVGALVAIGGVLTISFQPGLSLRVGALLVLAAAFLYALHAAIVKREGGQMDLGNFFLFRVAATTLFLALFAGLRGQLVWPARDVWPLLLLAGTVDVVISRVLYYQLLRRVRISLHAIILTLSPVVTILWSRLLFGTQPTPRGLAGGAAVLLGVAIATQAARRTARRAAHRRAREPIS